MLIALVVVIAVLAASYLILALNSLWVYALFDHALRNRRDSLPPSYELPRYVTKTPAGEADMLTRWPGWDGWYFFLLPDDRSLPAKMIRGSIMTGLYGLDGVDNNKALPPRVSAFEAVEHLFLAPSEITAAGGIEKANLLFHRYLPKSSVLTMKTDSLDVSIAGLDASNRKTNELWGRIWGAWPQYQFDFVHPEAKIAISVSYRAEDIVWWADVPGIFTYFASFGTYEGTLTYLQGSGKNMSGETARAEETYAFKGRGGFEHGCARKPFSFTRLWSPMRLLNAIVPRFHPVRYNYQLLIGDEGLHGGFMLAQGFGINFRNRGGFYLDGSYIPVQSIEIDYIEYGAGAPGMHPGSDGVAFPRKWRVRASTAEGVLEYTATHEWPPPPVSRNMTYYNFIFTGTYRGRQTSGRGYGEYLNI